MAEGHGGYRRPQKPAAVSGPGKFARRTDGGPTQPVREMTGGEYGEGAEMRALQSSAPLNASARRPAGSPPPPAVGGPDIQVPAFGAPTTSPEEPLTAGAPFGDGPGPEALGAPPKEDVEKFRPYLPVLIYVANRPGSSQKLRTLVRYLKGVL